MKIVYIFNKEATLIGMGKTDEIISSYGINRSILQSHIKCGHLFDYTFYFSRNHIFRIKPKKKMDKTINAKKKRVASSINLINSKRIQELRIEKKLSRLQLAALLGISLNVLWETEKIPFHNPTVKMIMKLAKYYDVEVTELLDMGFMEK